MLASVLRMACALDSQQGAMGHVTDASYVGDLQCETAAELVRLGWATAPEPGYLRLTDHDGLQQAIRTRSELALAPVARALTIWQPWAWAIATGHKTIENRPWRSKSGVDTWIAIHAGLSVDVDACDLVRAVTGVTPDITSRGGIVGVAKFIEVVPEDSADDLPDVVRQWFTGPYGWRFERAIELDTMIPCRGALSLWRLQEDTVKALAKVLGV